MDDELSEYTFDEIEIGLTKQFQITITESMIDDFAKLTGDFSPIHMDKDYASTTTFEKRVVDGMLLASFLSKIVGMYLPGKHALYFSQSLDFRQPCFIGDTITVSSIVIDKSPSTKILKIESKITNQVGKILLSGIGRVIVRDD
ncbi:MAG TPA: MaoC family dehydratase [Candidatus Nitrosopelagicus sp.]|nr:MaoC family dehydratase [Candidatus Nitrosopelagicus sp.]